MKVISLGLGVQSTALYYMSSMGELPRCDVAIFADLGKEKKKTMEYLEFLFHWQKENNGIEIIVIKKKDLYQDLLNQAANTETRFACIPAFTKNEDGSAGMLKRQCTSEYKIEQVDKTIRAMYGKQARERLPQTEVWKGISLDEMERMNSPREAWKISIFPFITYEARIRADYRRIDWSKKMSRLDILNWYAAHNLPVPPKSACVFCPYQSEKAWYEMKTGSPEDFEAAAKVDEAIRNSTKQGIKNPIYLHESCVPLREVKFSADAPDIFHGECSGECHT